MPELIRLGCAFCDRDDFDGVQELPTGWLHVTRIQSLADSRLPRDAAHELTQSCFGWQTHLGICPACQRELGLRA